ncbi:MAG: Succinate-acetate/proton symporter SatP [Candidatus Erwinia impunctatus]|nr:Succinate-acetate/proton symporter SatP [Culicoides impunctatus]
MIAALFIYGEFLNGISMGNNVLANPAPLGLMGFGMTTILLNIHNAGFFPIETAIVAMGIFYGGLAQVIAGILEYRKGNTFGLTAFTSYGFFWIVLVGIWYLPVSSHTAPTDPVFLGIFLALWGIFTAFMFIGTLKGNKVLQFVFGSLVVLFALLALGNILGNKTLIRIAGFEGIICGASAFYLAMAEVLKEQFGRDVLPIGAPKDNH